MTLPAVTFQMATATPASGNTGQAQPTPTPQTPPQDAENTYTVQEGDTMMRVALRFGITLAQLLEANAIEGIRALVPGEVLVIPLNSGA